MAFNLIEGDGGHAGGVPLTVLSKAGLAAWRETAPARERDWAAATGFTGEAGKLALVPDQASTATPAVPGGQCYKKVTDPSACRRVLSMLQVGNWIYVAGIISDRLSNWRGKAGGV